MRPPFPSALEPSHAAEAPTNQPTRDTVRKDPRARYPHTAAEARMHSVGEQWGRETQRGSMQRSPDTHGLRSIPTWCTHMPTWCRHTCPSPRARMHAPHRHTHRQGADHTHAPSHTHHTYSHTHSPKATGTQPISVPSPATPHLWSSSCTPNVQGVPGLKLLPPASASCLEGSGVVGKARQCFVFHIGLKQ